MIKQSNLHKVSLQLTKHNKEIEVRAEASGGQARGETLVPSESILTQIAAKNPSKLSQTTFDNIGETLYKSIMVGDVSKLVFDTLEESTRFKQSTHVELRFDADQISLAKYPWELIKNELGQFLVRDGIIDMTRCITYPQPMPSLRRDLHKISLLRVISQPPSLPPITAVELVVKNIETIIHATFSKFQRKLLVERISSWGLQFDGHGALVLKCQKCNKINELKAKKCIRCESSLSKAKRIGVLAFEHNGDVDFVTTDEFGSVLYNSGIQLALLLACETARVGNKIIFNGLAPGLILSGVPVVIGMQFPVLDSFANQFANTFYDVLLETGDLLKAVSTARRMNLRGAWYSPSLYLRSQPTEEENDKPVFQTRHIDTAVPSEVLAGDYFLVRLWVRRSTTKPFTDEELRKELGIGEQVDISTEIFESVVKFEKVKGIELHRGELLVQVQSPACEIKPESLKLFVDEHRDAPPAIFVVKPMKMGRIPLIFSVWQDQNMIASVIHQVEAVESYTKPKVIETNSSQIAVEKEIEPKQLEQIPERELIFDKLMRMELNYDILGNLIQRELITESVENKLLGLSHILRIFQICPMMGEPTVLDQMEHFSRCGQCPSYITENPREVELHLFLKGFLLFCYDKGLFQNMAISDIPKFKTTLRASL